MSTRCRWRLSEAEGPLCAWVVVVVWGWGSCTVRDSFKSNCPP